MIEGATEFLAANPVGDRLKAARESREMSLDDVATITRVPTRHLLHIERGEWDALPAVTYSVGFARAYANAVGLNGTEIGAELRAQLGSSQNPAATPFYEPADPARVPPRSLAIIAGVIALVLVIGYAIWRSNSVGDDDPQAQAVAADATAVAPAPVTAASAAASGIPASPAAAGASGPVVLTATDAVWLRVYEEGGKVIYENTMRPGDRFEIPATAQRPMIRAGRPEALRVTVGQSVIPQLGITGQPIGNISLTAPDLLARLPQAAASAPPPATNAPPRAPAG